MVRIAFTDWWPGFDIHNNFITASIKGLIDYEVVENPDASKKIDFLFCSIWGKDSLKIKCPRVAFTGENVIPDLNLYDYVIGYSHWRCEDRIIRYPEYAACNNEISKLIEQPFEVDEYLYERDFCSFVVSNSFFANDYREQLFNELSKYRFVASGGRLNNNIGMPNGVTDKMKFISNYKFNIACENSSCAGYCTEKIIQAFLAKTIPIYWGDPMIAQYFNSRAFIDCRKFVSFTDLVEYVEEIDNNPQKYMDMISQDRLASSIYSIEELDKQLKNWLYHLLTQKPSDSYRRPIGGWNVSYENEIIEVNRYYNDKDTKMKKVINSIKNKLF